MKNRIRFIITWFFISAVNSSVAQSSGDFRSRQAGVWSAITSWQTYNGSNWVDASATPSSINGIITILSGHVVTSNTLVTADQIVVNNGGTLIISGSSFTVNAATVTDLACSGTLTLSGGTLNGAGTITLNSGSTCNWSSGTNSGSGVFTINAGGIFNINSSNVFLADTKTINNYGVCTWTGSSWYYTSAPVFNNYGSLNINTDADVFASGTTTGTFNNKAGGIINKIGSPSDETAFNSISSFTNAGTININSGRLKLNVASVHTGIINTGFGAHMNFSAGIAFLNAGTAITGAGYLNFEGGADTINAASISVKNINLTNAIVNITSEVSMSNGSIFSQSGGRLTGSGTITFNSGSTFNWTGGYHSGSGSITIASGAHLNMDGSVNLTDTKTINNYGEWAWTSGTLFYTGAPVVNNYGALNISTDADVYASGATTGVFNNRASGIINKIGSPSEETSFNNIGIFTNAGTISIASGEFKLNINSVHTGITNTAFGANMSYSSGNAVFNTGTVLSGDGNLNFEGGADTINAAAISVKNINLSNATVNITPEVSMSNGSTFNQSGGRLTGSGMISFNPGSIFNWTGGYHSGSGSITIASGAHFNIDGSVNLTDTKTINNYGECTWASGNLSFTGAPVINNYGTFNISNDYGVYASGTTTGVFNNLASGIISKIGSPTGETSFNGISSFNNAGTVKISSGNLALNIVGTHTGTYYVDYGAGLKGSTTMNFTGNLFANDGTVTLTGLTFSGTTVQSLNGIGTINTLTINNMSEVLLTESQTIKTNLTVKSNSKLVVYSDLIRQ